MICPVRVVLQFSGFNVTVEVLHELLQKVRARKRMTKDIHSNDISTLYPRVTGRLILKNCFFLASALAGKPIMGWINKSLYSMFFACGVWCIADVSSVKANANGRNIVGQQHATLLDQGARKDGRGNVPLPLRNVRCAETPEDS